MNTQNQNENEITSISTSNNSMIIPLVNIINNQPINLQQTNNTTGGIQLNGEMQVELNRINDKLKLLLPFIILVLLKYLFDNFLIGLILIVNFYMLYRIQNYFNIQLSLKDRSNKNMLVLLLLSVISLLCMDLFLMNLLFDNNHLIIIERLQLKYPINQSKLSFLSIIWYCFITDGLLQILSIVCKLIICILVGTNSCLDPIKWRINTLFPNTNNSNRTIITPTNESYDIENGLFSSSIVSNDNHTNQYNNNIAFNTLSTLSSSISGLVHRSIINHSSNRQPSNSSRTTRLDNISSNRSNIIDTSINTISNANINNINDDTTSSDADDILEYSLSPSESESYLIRLRICTLVDMICLIYRTIIPIPLWSYYFNTTKVFGIGLKLTYILIKLFDLSWKTKGIIIAFDIFFRNKLEFGHYSTPEELHRCNDSSAIHDCPICFDKFNKPITLECTHIFCEVCISEWIDKEKSCPVCRSEVKCISTLLHAMKEASSVKHPLVI